MKKKSSNLVKQKPCQMSLRSEYRNSKLQKSYGEIIEIWWNIIDKLHQKDMDAQDWIDYILKNQVIILNINLSINHFI